MDAARGRSQARVKIYVNEENEPPKACELEVPYGLEFQPLHDLVSETILGGESERWSLVRETRTPHLEPDGSGHVEVAQEWQSREATLHTHPADDCCPVTTLEASELRGGADLYSVMLGQVARLPLQTSQDLSAWWASHPRSGAPVLSAACARLLAKLRVAPSPHAPLPAAAKLVQEGLAGLRELAADRWYGNRLPLEVLEEGLMAALRWEQHTPPDQPAQLADILEAAAAVAWALTAYGGHRSALLSYGVVPELVSSLRKAHEWRRLAVERGAAAAAEAAAVQAERTAVQDAALAAEAVAAAAAEAEAAAGAKTVTEQLAAAEAADAAADAALRTPLPDAHAVSLRDCYEPPVGQVSLDAANRLVYNCLGALGVLAVDARARSACLTQSAKLDFLLVAATADFPVLAAQQLELDVAAWQRRRARRAAADAAGEERRARRRVAVREMRRRARQEAREAAAAAIADAKAAAELADEIRAMAAAEVAAEDPEMAKVLRNKESLAAVEAAVEAGSSGGAAAVDEAAAAAAREAAEAAAREEEERAEAAAEAAADEEEEAPGGDGGGGEAEDPYPELGRVAPEADPRVQQLVAAEALYAMLGRERRVRRAFAAAGGVAALEALLRCANDGVVVAAVSALAAYARDAGHDHTTGLDMLIIAAPPPPPPPAAAAAAAAQRPRPHPQRAALGAAAAAAAAKGPHPRKRGQGGGLDGCRTAPRA